jgi:hypothetical protein
MQMSMRRHLLECFLSWIADDRTSERRPRLACHQSHGHEALCGAPDYAESAVEQIGFFCILTRRIWASAEQQCTESLGLNRALVAGCGRDRKLIRGNGRLRPPGTRRGCQRTARCHRLLSDRPRHRPVLSAPARGLFRRRKPHLFYEGEQP